MTETKPQLTLRERWNRFRQLTTALGVRAATKFLLAWYRLEVRRASEYWIRPRRIIHPLCVRRDSSDFEVFSQIFVEREYGCLDDMTDVHLVIDCGAYVGYSAAYFLSRHPHCLVVAVEPDLGNFDVLRRNLAPYGNRVKLVRAGVWSHIARLSISQGRYRDGREWTKQVRLCGPDERADLEGVDVGTLLASTGHGRISILKVDVEGAEAVIFSENYQSWLDKVDALAIELHDDSTFGKGSEVFFSAIAGHGFQVSRGKELTLCLRPGLIRRSA